MSFKYFKNTKKNKKTRRNMKISKNKKNTRRNMKPIQNKKNTKRNIIQSKNKKNSRRNMIRSKNKKNIAGMDHETNKSSSPPRNLDPARLAYHENFVRKNWPELPAGIILSALDHPKQNNATTHSGNTVITDKTREEFEEDLKTRNFAESERNLAEMNKLGSSDKRSSKGKVDNKMISEALEQLKEEDNN